mgnify:CR=1 FL=1
MSIPQVILTVRLSALGDVAMTVPAVCSVALAYPETSMYVLTLTPFAPLFKYAPSNVHLLLVDKQEIRTLFGLYKTLRKIRRELRPNTVADLHNVLRSWLIDLYFSCYGCRVAILNKRRLGRLSLWFKKPYEQQRPFTRRYFDVFKKIGLEADASDFFLSLSSKHTSIKQSETPLIGIAPFARYQGKTYPPQLMRRSVKLLLKTTDCHILLFAGRSEAELAVVKRWQRESPRVTSVAGQYTLEQELDIMRSCALMLTMDSANMHLASLVGVRVVSLWGCTTPACGFLGWRQHKEDVIVAGLACQPCSVSGTNHCRYQNFPCLVAITPEMIVEKVKTILQC